MSISHLLDRTVTVFKPGNTENADGSIDRTALETVDGVKARIRPLSASEAFRGARQEIAVSHVLYFETGIDMKPGYDVLDHSTGLQYRVLGVRPPSVPHHLEVDAELTQERQD